jgi:hypothetical protein
VLGAADALSGVAVAEVVGALAAAEDPEPLFEQ